MVQLRRAFKVCSARLLGSLVPCVPDLQSRAGITLPSSHQTLEQSARKAARARERSINSSRRALGIFPLTLRPGDGNGRRKGFMRGGTVTANLRRREGVGKSLHGAGAVRLTCTCQGAGSYRHSFSLIELESHDFQPCGELRAPRLCLVDKLSSERKTRASRWP